MGWINLFIFHDGDGRVVTQFQGVNRGCLGWQAVVDGFPDFAEALSRRTGREFHALHPGRRPGRGAQYRMTITVCAAAIAWLMARHARKFARGEIRLRRQGGRPTPAEIDAARRWLKAHPAAFGLDGPVEAS